MIFGSRPEKEKKILFARFARNVSSKRFDVFNKLKTELHQEIIEKMDLESLVRFDDENARFEVERFVSDLIGARALPINADEKKSLTKEVVDEIFGLGPLEPLLEDPTIDEIMVNNSQTVYIERFGKIEKTLIRFKDDMHLRHIINRIVARIGRRIDDSSPMVDARLEDGSRVNAVIPPLALDGSSLCIRRFKKIPITCDDMVKAGCVSPEIVYLLHLAIRSKVNIVISGGTGSGKTTLLNVLSGFIPENERVVTIEDAAELQLRQPHVVRLETRPPNMEGKGGIDQRDLFRNSLRMRPDRILVGEVRGAEALDMLQAMNTGHDGSLTTIHANSPRDALGRIETMVLMSNFNMTQSAIHKQISSAINMVVQIRRYADGVRRIESVAEVVGMEQNMITMQEIACYVQKGVSKDNQCLGMFKIHDIRPFFLEKARTLGLMNEEEMQKMMKHVSEARIGS